MTIAEWAGGSGLPQVGQRRADVLACLRGADHPQSAAEVASATGLHVNTARTHLDALVRDGLADGMTETRETPGRPRILYTSEGSIPGQRSFQMLAEILTGLVSSLDDGDRLAFEAGEAWGKHLIERPPPSRTIDAPEALARLQVMLEGLGFRPESQGANGHVEVTLRNCPFREIALEHTGVVCGLHRGMLQGALGELRAPVEATSLQPFVTPQACVARLRTDAGPPTRTQRTG